MTNFKDLKRQIDKLLRKAEDEALNEGVDITSNEFQLLIRELKRKILAEKGINLEEYDRLENELENEEINIDDGELEKLTKSVKKNYRIKKEETEAEKKEFNNKIKRLQEEYSDKIDTLKEEQDDKIQVLTDKTDIGKEELLSEIKILVNKSKEQGVVSNKQLKELKEWFLREALRKDREIDEIKDLIKSDTKTIDGLTKLQKGLTKEVDIVKKKDVIPKKLEEDMKRIAGTDWQGLIQSGIKDLTPRLWHGMAYGLQNKINDKIASSNFIDNETPTGLINGSNKTFTLDYSPNPTTSLKVYRNGIRQELTTHYTLSGATLSTVIALPTGTNLKVDYKI